MAVIGVVDTLYGMFNIITFLDCDFMYLVFTRKRANLRKNFINRSLIIAHVISSTKSV